MQEGGDSEGPDDVLRRLCLFRGQESAVTHSALPCCSLSRWTRNMALHRTLLSDHPLLPPAAMCSVRRCRAQEAVF